MRVSRLAVFALTVAFALASADAWAAKKKRAKPAPVAAPSVTYDDRGTPIIMQGYRSDYGIPDIMREEKGVPPRRADRPAGRPRGSSTLIPPPVPSPNAANSPPSPVLLQHPPPAVYPPPARNSFGDRVINCIHSAPLNTGVGNNPANPQAYIRQCAN
jgi:hypothetical protein